VTSFAFFEEVTMTQRYTNVSNIPLSVAVWLATDNYDHNPDKKTISVTTLMKSVRQIVLSQRIPDANQTVDIATLIASRMGTAFHESIERSWIDPSKALQALGYPRAVRERIRINPEPSELSDDIIPVYMEQRSEKLVGDYTVSGKYDFIAEGRIEDFKSTSTYSYTAGNNDNKYILQGSLYRWLNPTIVTADTIQINFIFTDWSAIKARSDHTYPQSRVVTKQYDLLSLAYTDQYVNQKIREITSLLDAPESALPECTDEELWRKETVYKYYKNPNKRDRSTKNFHTKQEALIRLVEDNSVGIVIDSKGEVIACRYCNAYSICTQKESLIASGDLNQ